MPNYQNGKIYKIMSFKTDDIYIGATTQQLCKRMAVHRHEAQNIRMCTSRVILDQDPDAKIILIKNFPCNTKAELEAEEMKIINEMTCVNKNKGQSKDPNYDINRQKDYYLKNKEKHNQCTRKYYEDHKDNIKKKRKLYKNNNKDYISEKFACECGGSYIRNHKSTHEKTKKHQHFFNN